MRRTLIAIFLSILTIGLFVGCPDNGKLPSAPVVVPEEVYFIRDAEYQDGRIFELFLPGEASRNDVVRQVYLFQEANPSQYPISKQCSVYVDPPNPAAYPGTAEFYWLARLEDDQFEVYNDTACNKHYVVMSQRHSLQQGMAASMVVDRFDQGRQFLRTDTIGNVFGDTLTLKMLVALRDMEPSHPVWPLTWRNCYGIPMNSSVDELELSICLAPIGLEDTSALDYRQLSPDSLDEGHFITLLGLDQYNRDGLKLPDGVWDDRLAVFRPDWGLIIFPSARPFDSDTTFVDQGGARTAPLRFRVPELYDYSSMNERIQASHYYLQVRIRMQ